jgi:hypothetical protein
VALVALVANVSAVRRLAKLFAAVGRPRVPAPAPAAAPEIAESTGSRLVDDAIESSVTRTREPEALVPIDAAR